MTESADIASYKPQDIEKRVLSQWAQNDIYATDEGAGAGEPFYVLEMFPYPSGALHMGHVRNYTIGDVFARFARMRGRTVLHPMGWDALGLPAENQAIKEGVAPQKRTPLNIAEMRAQMERLGLSYDWSREIATYKPEYYRWNQWFFIEMHKRDLVYRRESQVNWCDGCDTVLANEQVREDGSCWRGHEGVSQRKIPEWAFRITKYADELLSDLKQLSAWPERIVSQQRHWIGRSVGASVRFPVSTSGASDGDAAPTEIEVFTTRVDTIFGCTYVVLAPEYPGALELTTDERRAEVAAFINAQAKVDKIERTAAGGDKLGVDTGARAINPYNGEEVPVWLANFVLADYGTGAVMSVPAHDHRDHEFARQYGLPIRPVVFADEESAETENAETCEAFVKDGYLRHSGDFNGLSSAAAREKMATKAQDRGFGAASVNWHLRDWGFSRQRYWGTPIPIVYCDRCGTVPVSPESLPVVLPDFEDVGLTGDGGAPLAKLESFVNAHCPSCNGPATREVETMDTFVDSAWYFARFLSPNSDAAPFDSAAAKKWLPVDVYVGGPEHAVMHLLYFRFWTKVMRDLGLVEIDEPATRLITQGMVNAPAFRCGTHGYIPPVEVEHNDSGAATCPHDGCGRELSSGIEKMSKSKYNGVDPISLINTYGADTARLYTLFAAPPERDLEWNQDGVEGLGRFASRVFRLVAAQGKEVSNSSACASMDGLGDDDAKVRRGLHHCLERVTREISDRNHFNTAISAMMELVNLFYGLGAHDRERSTLSPSVLKESLSVLAQMLSPFAPFLAEECWQRLGNNGFVCASSWPQVDEAALVVDEMTIAVQINGKRRSEITVAATAEKATILEAAQADQVVNRHLGEKQIVKEIYVPRRLVNLVVRG